MDALFQPVIDAVNGIVAWLIPVILAITALKFLLVPKLKGLEGEAAAARIINRLGEKALHDIVLPDGKGGLTQIDHIALTAQGFLVLETKNYAGLILGSERDRQWTQQLGNTTHRFQNPLHQNALHVVAVQRLQLGIPVYGRVVFTDRAKFPKGRPPGVSLLGSLREDTREELGEGTPSPTLLAAWERLEREARTDRAARRAHLAGVVQKHGTDRRRPFALAMLGVAGVWMGALWITGKTPFPESPITPVMSTQPRSPTYSPPLPRIEIPSPSFPVARAAPQRILGYREERVPGRPLAECMGPDKELNEEVLRCRNGYTVKFPIFTP